MLQSIFFDFDDTLIATKDLAYEKHKLAAEALNLKMPSRKEFFAEYGLPWKKFIAKTFSSASFEDFTKEYFKNKEKYLPIAGANETLKFLSSKNLFLGILTTRAIDSVKLHAQKFFPNTFHSIHSCSEAFHKPDPKSFDEVINVLNERKIPLEKTLYVGDSLHDFFASKDAGLNFVAVLTGYHFKKDFLNNGLSEDRMLSSLAELKPYLLKNNLL